MRRKFYLSVLVLVSLLGASLFSSCSDEDSELTVSVEVSDITAGSAVISWDIISIQALGHEVVVTDEETGDIVFEETAGVNLTTSKVYTEITATGLSAETKYTVTVTALSLDENLNSVNLGEGSTNFVTVEGDPLLEVSEDEIVGTWVSSTQYYVFKSDKTGESGSHSDFFGDEKENDIDWEITSYEYNGAVVRSIKATDSEGYWNDLEVVVIDDVMKLKDHDNNYSFTKQ